MITSKLELNVKTDLGRGDRLAILETTKKSKKDRWTGKLSHQEVKPHISNSDGTFVGITHHHVVLVFCDERAQSKRNNLTRL